MKTLPLPFTICGVDVAAYPASFNVIVSPNQIEISFMSWHTLSNLSGGTIKGKPSALR
jgi:hypothetical protein